MIIAIYHYCQSINPFCLLEAYQINFLLLLLIKVTVAITDVEKAFEALVVRKYGFLNDAINQNWKIFNNRSDQFHFSEKVIGHIETCSTLLRK